MKRTFLAAGHLPIVVAGIAYCFGEGVGLTAARIAMPGDVGGFAHAAMLGCAKEFTDSYALSFMLFALPALAAWSGIAAARLRWRQDADRLAGVRV